ncbi:hypothetical protein QQF64_032133 [Cirrhinus molitorella]|uniref:Uncharacterized protein n=1 Tax=Cirrhinus molitorella TaxID=172907 RepID=A0ABR3MYY0_9TELE
MLAYSTSVAGDPLRIRWILDAVALNTDNQAVYLWHPEFNISLQLKLWKCTPHADTRPTSLSVMLECKTPKLTL